ncbi:MAG: HAD family phosphatase [Candidatus Aenigmatarchaeota archaeon]
MTIRAVIFDLDGVIADSEPISGKSTAMVLGKRGIRLTDEERRLAFGRRSPDIFRDALRSRGMKFARVDIETMVGEKNAIMLDLMKGNLKAVPGSLELIGFLSGKGLKLALATSSHRDKMEMELRELGINELFPIIVTGDDVSKGKPDPEIFLLAARRLGVPPSECAVIEDSAFGVQAAKRAGMFAIGFASRNSPGQDLSGADFVVSDLGEAAAFISRAL